MFVAELFLPLSFKKHGKHLLLTDNNAWHPQACKSLKPEHQYASPHEKRFKEMVIEYIKDRTECLHDYFFIERGM